MRKLFKKLLAVVLVGAMVGNVACNDYDDDINNLNDRLDEIEGKVALQVDLDAVKATVAQLNAIDFGSFATNAALNEAIAKCASKDDIKNFLSSEAINQLIADAVAAMQSKVDALDGKIGETNKALDALKGMFEAYDAWAEVKAEVEAAIAEALKPYLKAEDAVTMEAVNKAIAAAVADALTVEDVEKTIDAWMGVNFAEYIAPYKADLEGAIDDVKEELLKANADLKEELVKMIDEAQAADEKYIDAAELKSVTDAYDTKIKALEDRIAALEDKINALIQNIAFVSEYADNKATALKLVPVANDPANTLSATLLTAYYEITPAESAAKIVEMMETEAEEVSMKIQPLKSRAGELIVLGEKDLTIEAVKDIEGRIKVTAKVPGMDEGYADYNFAFSVKTEESEAASDYEEILVEDTKVFSYVWVTSADKKAMAEDAAYVENPYENFKDGANEIAGWINYNVKFSKAYDSAVELLAGYELMLVDANKNILTTADVEQQYDMASGALTPKAFKTTWIRNRADYAGRTRFTYFVEEDGTRVFPNYKLNPTSVSEKSLTVAMNNSNPRNMISRVDQYNIYKIESTDCIVPAAYVCYTITGPKIEENVIHIEEVGDLAWLMHNSANLPMNPVVEFAKDVVLDFAEQTIKGEFGELSFTYMMRPVNVGNKTTASVATVNGNGATIKNLKINATNNAGLFGELIGDVSNLKVVDSEITGRHWVGAIAGTAFGNIKNCDVENTTVIATPANVGGVYDDGDKVGAVVGYLPSDDEAATKCFAVEDCDVTGVTVQGFRDVGGVVGAANTNASALVKNNTVANSAVVADQRLYLYPGYTVDASAINAGAIIGRLINAEKYDHAAAGNSASNTTVKVMVADGADLNPATETLEISKPFGLAWFSQNLTTDARLYENVALVADLDMEKKLSFADDGYSMTFTPIDNWGAGEVPTKYSFDGANHTIKNFELIQPNKKNLAIFGKFEGDVKNLKLDAAKVVGLGRVAGIAAQAWGNIDNCHVTNSTFKAAVANGDDGDKVGAIVAQMQEDGEGKVSNTITNCVVDKVEVEGFRDLAALAGHAELAAWDASNKVTNTNIWIDHKTAYYGSYKPFDTAAAYVGRHELETTFTIPNEAPEADNVHVYALVQRGNYKLVVNRENHLGIADAAAMAYLRYNHQNFDGAFLFNDIELSGEWSPIGTSFDAAFKGTFDGKGYTIKGLKINNPIEAAALFGHVIGDIKNVKIVNPEINGKHWAAALVAVMYGSVEGCEVNGGKILVQPEYMGSAWDNGDKAAALVGYLAASGDGSDRVQNNIVKGVTVKGFRDVAALVGRANNIDEMSGNKAIENTVIIDQVTGYYEGEEMTIGKLIGLLDSDTAANVKNNDSASTILYSMTTSGTQKLADDKQVDVFQK